MLRAYIFWGEFSLTLRELRLMAREFSLTLRELHLMAREFSLTLRELQAIGLRCGKY